jgi:endonuclease/exonuclease/phosphatase family metal-dependent hydrolase
MATPITGLANWIGVEQALAGEGICIASYNVHGCVGADGKADAARVAQVIIELGSDVVGLQEVGDAGLPDDSLQLDVLARETGMQPIAGFTRVGTRGELSFGNALLTRLPVLAVHRHDFSYPGHEARGALDVALDFAGKPIRVIVTHLGLRPRERRFQVKRMLSLLHDIPIDCLVVVLGDINEWLPLGRPLRWLHGLLGHAPAERSFPARLPVFALDRVWVRPRHALLALTAHRSPAARTASDHLPVKALISLALHAPHQAVADKRPHAESARPTLHGS